MNDVIAGIHFFKENSILEGLEEEKEPGTLPEPMVSLAT